jgi:hypothetical protein
MSLTTSGALKVRNLWPEQSKVRALPRNNGRDFWQLQMEASSSLVTAHLA